MRHIISILLQNEAGALTRVAGLFSTRGYNIESLSVAPTDQPTVSRLTLVTTGNDAVINQIVSQLQKLVDVVTVADMTSGGHYERELALMKFRASERGLDPLVRLVTDCDGKVLQGTLGSFVVALTSSEAEINHFIAQATQHAELTEIVRSGALAISQGQRVLRLPDAGQAPVA
ncbi:MAG: acetolactate synthase small subunit [Steroidobacteraceae bacterium]|nr:acetolactate synthase small subunit [Steroidobacteraceae bacterium]